VRSTPLLTSLVMCTYSKGKSAFLSGQLSSGWLQTAGQHVSHPISRFLHALQHGSVRAFKRLHVPHRLLHAPEEVGTNIMLETVPQRNNLTRFAKGLAAQRAIGLLTPRNANADGYLLKRNTTATPVILPVLFVRADLLQAQSARVCRTAFPRFPTTSCASFQSTDSSF
jgi:hypothetical protein